MMQASSGMKRAGAGSTGTGTGIRKTDPKKGVIAFIFCYLIWGFQPLYWNLCDCFDTSFLMGCRIVWAAVTCLGIVVAQEKTDQLKTALRNRSVLKREIPAAVFLLSDWVVYLFAVRNGRVQECSLGYYIMPLLVFTSGAVLYHEKTGSGAWLALLFVVAGVIASFRGFGHAPWVVVALSICFAVYSAIKKSLEVDSIVSTTIEILFMAPLAVLYLLFFSSRETGFGALTVQSQLFLIGSGLVTGLPMVFYSIGVRHLPLTAAGISEYFSPTLGIVCSLIMGEQFTKDRLLSFVLIWIGILIFLLSAGKYRQGGTAEQ